MNDFVFSEPLDHVLSRAGVCSDRSFKNFIKSHRVEILKAGSGAPEKAESRNLRIDADSDTLMVDGCRLELPPHLYVLLNKPSGVVSSRVSDSHQTVFDFLQPAIKAHAFYKHLHVAGRLDSDSRGLVLFTTNGSLSNFLSSPETHVEKTYRVLLRDSVDPEKQKEYDKAFRNGMNLPPEKKAEGFTSKPAKLKFISPTCCEVVVSEGKFHQVRRMFSFLGNNVTDLQRTAIGKLKVPENLPEGQYCILTREMLKVF